jgi:hypothetical protein
MAELFRSVKYDKISPDVVHNFIEHGKTSAIRGKVVSAANAAAAATWDAAWRMSDQVQLGVVHGYYGII